MTEPNSLASQPTRQPGRAASSQPGKTGTTGRTRKSGKNGNPSGNGRQGRTGGLTPTLRQIDDMRQAQVSRVLYWRFFVNLALMLCDMAMFVIGMTAVLTLLDATGTLPSERFSTDVNLNAFTVVSAIVWVLCLRGVGLYHRHVMGDGYEVNAKLIDGAIRSWICLSALAYVLDLRLTLVGLTLGVAAGLLLTIVERVVSRMVITRHRSRGAYSYATVVVGSPEGIARTLRFLSRKQQLNYRPVAVCPIRLDKRTGLVVADDDADALRRSVLDHWPEMSVIRYGDRELAETFVRRQIQTVMVSDVMTRFSDNFNTFSVRMETLGLEIALIASAADAAGHETQVRSLHGTTILTLRLSQYAPTVAFAKRVFDLVVSALAIVCSLIVTLPVAIAIKLTDGGPVFYTQTRIGRRGRPFQMIKFRSMVTNADELKAKLAAETGQEDRFIFKMKDDPRITSVGKFIRRFSIDELPQFLNVFKGDMSVVGPRPPLPEEYARYNQVYATRMLVKPGITGPWQVSGRSDLSAEESEQLDVAYVQNWSIIGDVILMFRTVGAVLGHKGAY